MRLKAFFMVLLGIISLGLLLANLYGITLFANLLTGRTTKDAERIRGEDEVIDGSTTSQPEIRTTKHHRLKYQFNRTTGTWERRPVETTTHRQKVTTVHHRPRKPSTKYYVHHETTTTSTEPTTTITTTTSTVPPLPEITHPIVYPQETTTRLPFRISTVRITTHRDHLTTTTHHHRKHHEHRQHHHHHEHTTEMPETTTTKIYTHRNNLQWNHERYSTSHHPTTTTTSTTTTTTSTTTTTTTESPRPTTIVTHRHQHHRHDINDIIDDDEGIVIEREDLIGEKSDEDEYDILLPPIHVNRNNIPTPQPSSSSPRIVIDEDGVRDVNYDDEISEVTSLKPTTTTNSVDEEGGMTVVTALMDIGRGEWFEYRRPLEKYHSYMENVLSLKVNMVIFTDKSSVDFVLQYRKEMGLIKKTKVYNITLDDLPLARYHFHAQKIIEDELKTPELWRKWDPQMQKHPEAKSPEYDILVNSKTFFLYNATLEDPFSSDWFVWLDAGYGHGDQTPFPVDNSWRPQFPRRKISVIKVTPDHDQMSNWSLDKLYRQNWSVISGGFLAGERHAIGQLHTLVHRKFVELINMDRVDDDQTVLVLVIQSHPHLFNVIHGDWFDAFAKFPSVK